MLHVHKHRKIHAYDMDKKQPLHQLNYRAPMWVWASFSPLELFMSLLKFFYLINNIISLKFDVSFLRTFDLNVLKGIEKWLKWNFLKFVFQATIQWVFW